MQTAFARGSSSLYRLEAHVSFKVKYCHKVFDYQELRQRCEELFLEAAAKSGFSLKELGFDRDHVHFILSWKITQSISGIAKLLKGTSGKKLLKEFPEIKKKYFWGSGLWSPTIYCDAVGRNPTEMSAYVRGQAFHSAKFQKSLREFMNAGGL